MRMQCQHLPGVEGRGPSPQKMMELDPLSALPRLHVSYSPSPAQAGGAGQDRRRYYLNLSIRTSPMQGEGWVREEGAGATHRW